MYMYMEYLIQMWSPQCLKCVMTVFVFDKKKDNACHKLVDTRFHIFVYPGQTEYFFQKYPAVLNVSMT